MTDSQTQELVGHILNKGQITPALRSHLTEAAAGYPLFVGELLGMLIDDRTLRLVDGRWTVSGDLADIRLPGAGCRSRCRPCSLPGSTSCPRPSG